MKVDFIGIGAPKCGTTWIAKCLSEHPQIFVPDVKELFWFNRRVDFSRINLPFWHDKGYAEKWLKFFEDEEREQIKDLYGIRHLPDPTALGVPSPYDRLGIKPYFKFFRDAREDQISGEYSVSYIYDPIAAKKIKNEFPDVKILVCLRNPIERSYSHFHFNKYLLLDTSESFEEAIKRYPGTYIDASCYYHYLKAYFDIFPRENILVMIYEDSKKDPLRFIQNIYRFLGVDTSFYPPSLNSRTNPTGEWRHPILGKLALQVANKIMEIGGYKIYYFMRDSWLAKYVLGKPVKRPPMKPETREYLTKIFADDIQKLEELIDRDLSFWLHKHLV